MERPSNHTGISRLSSPRKENRDTKIKKKNARDEDNDSSSSYSSKDRPPRPLQIIESRTDQPKFGHTYHRSRGYQRRARQTARVNKRRVNINKKKYTVRKCGVRRKPRRELRNKSTCSIFTKISSKLSHTSGCKFCGHRYNIKRCYFTIKRKKRRTRRQRDERRILRKDFLDPIIFTHKAKKSRRIQVGSRCAMLSPLYVATNSIETPRRSQNELFVEISPEMIYESLRELTMWRQLTEIESIQTYIKLHYPVNPQAEELTKELMFKLHVAETAGIVTKSSSVKGEDCWCISCPLMNRYLTQNDVSLFWEIYNDSMSPVQRKRGPKSSNVDISKNL